MDVRFPFCHRDRELNTLITARDAMTKERDCRFFLVQGRRGIGKTALVRAFLDHNDQDVQWRYRIGNTDPRQRVIEFDCQADSRAYLEPFQSIGQQIKQRSAGKNIVLRFLMLLISWLPFYDILDALDELKKSYEKQQDDEDDGGAAEKRALAAKQTDVFGKYVDFLKKQSRRTPLFIYIRNVQWLDEHSMDLLDELVVSRGFWGMIFLEEGRVADGDPKVLGKLRKLTATGQVQRLQLLAMEKGFEKTVLRAVFGDAFFNESEYDMIYAVSDGVPGLLQHKIDNWLRSECIWRAGDAWRKHENFAIMIRDPLETMLDLVVTVSADEEIDARERMLLDTFAAIFGIDQETISEMIAVVMGSTRLGYTIERRLRTGSMGKHTLEAVDPSGSPVILQFLPGAEYDQSTFAPRDVRHQHLMTTRDVHPVEGGVVLVYEYADGLSLVEQMKRRRSEHLRETYDTARAIAAGLAELHRNGYSHGALRPDLVLCGADGKILISGLDAARLGLRTRSERRYLAPEAWNGGETTSAADVYAFGAIVFEMLTGELPYPALAGQETPRSELFENRLTVPDAPQSFVDLLSKCLREKPQRRFSSGQELLAQLEQLDDEIENFKEDEVVAPPSPPRPHRPRVPRWARVAAAAVVVAGLGWGAWQLFRPTEALEVATGCLVVEDFAWQDETEASGRQLRPEMLQLLVTDVLERSGTGLRILSREQFDADAGDRRLAPEGSLDITIRPDGVGNVLDCRLVSRTDGEENVDLPVSVFGEASLIHSSIGPSKVEEIVDVLLSRMNRTRHESLMMTTNWDAFEDYCRGNDAWDDLKPTEASTALTQAILRDEDFALARLRLTQVYDWNGDDELALEQIALVMENLDRLNPDDQLQAKALDASLDARPSDAIEHLSELYERRRTKESAYEVAEAYYEVCDIRNAIDFYDRALAMDATYAKAINHRGYCYAHLGQHDSARVEFERYVVLDSTANSFDSQGDGFMVAGQLAEAAEAKNKAIEEDPGVAYIYESLCYIDALRGRFAAAERDVDNYAEQSAANNSFGEGRQSRAAYMRALVDYLAGDAWAAVEHCDEALAIIDSDDLVKRDHDLHWLRALAHAQIGDMETVEREFAVMDRLVREHELSSINYRMGLYKYWLHVRALRAAYDGDVREVEAVAEELWSEQLHIRLRDHTSPIGPAFLNALMADLFLMEQCDRPDLARRCIDTALAYNPNHPLALHRQMLLGDRFDEQPVREAARARLAEVWEGADEVVRTTYGL